RAAAARMAGAGPRRSARPARRSPAPGARRRRFRPRGSLRRPRTCRSPDYPRDVPFADMDRRRLALTAGVGLAAGFLSGVFGIGGGILVVPGLVVVLKMGQ